MEGERCEGSRWVVGSSSRQTNTWSLCSRLIRVLLQCRVAGVLAVRKFLSMTGAMVDMQWAGWGEVGKRGSGGQLSSVDGAVTRCWDSPGAGIAARLQTREEHLFGLLSGRHGHRCLPVMLRRMATTSGRSPVGVEGLDLVSGDHRGVRDDMVFVTRVSRDCDGHLRARDITEVIPSMSHEFPRTSVGNGTIWGRLNK